MVAVYEPAWTETSNEQEDILSIAWLLFLSMLRKIGKTQNFKITY